MGSLALLLNARRITSTACWCVTPPRLSPSTDSSSYPACKTQNAGWGSAIKDGVSSLPAFLRSLLVDTFHKSAPIASLGRNLIYATENWGSPTPLMYSLWRPSHTAFPFQCKLLLAEEHAQRQLHTDTHRLVNLTVWGPFNGFASFFIMRPRPNANNNRPSPNLFIPPGPPPQQLMINLWGQAKVCQPRISFCCLKMHTCPHLVHTHMLAQLGLFPAGC